MLFDRYIAIDWSAANSPRTGRDSIWLAEARWREGRLSLEADLNPATRFEAMAALTSRLTAARAAGERVLVGCDFAFGYPVGTAVALTGQADWQAVWALIAGMIDDDAQNRSNRFAVAGTLNARLGGARPRFWGHPPGAGHPGLTPTRPEANRAARRTVETLVPSAKSVFQLTGAGAVGAQTLLGIAHLERLRRAPELAGRIAIWPFETGFDADLSAPVVIAEIYPALAPIPKGDAVRDRAQVEAVARWFAQADRRGRLGALLAAPAALSPDGRAAALEEEGWIAGVGAPPNADRFAYERDPARIYAQSFAAIAAEAGLSHLATALHPLATRMIHASGMVDLAADIAGTPDLAAAAQEALRAGRAILCDCEMVRSGLIARLLPPGTTPIVTLNDARVPRLAKARGTTRSAAAVDLWLDHLAGAVVVIGNAPTALFRLLELIEAGAPPPAAIIATPVGFVGAAESKAALAEEPHGVPFLTVRGRRGGSAIAAAALNAVAAGPAR